MKTVIVFARTPILGQVKTRLAREIGLESALGLYVAMLRDSLAKASLLSRLVAGESVLAHTSMGSIETEGDAFRLLRDEWRGLFWEQPEGDLGVRMHGAIGWALGRGASSVALLGTDAPDFRVDDVAAGFERLERHETDVLLGPARDGGFWTLVCARTLPGKAFELDWERGATLASLRANLQESGVKVSCEMSQGDDVDDLPSLKRLCLRLSEGAPKYLEAPHTALWLQENGWL